MRASTLAVGIVVGLILLMIWAYRADVRHCNRMLTRAHTGTDSLVVLTSRRCALIAGSVE